MKRFYYLLRLLIATLAIGSSVQVSATSVRVGYAPNTFYAPILVAKQNGWLEEELITVGNGSHNVEWRSFSAGPLMNEAIVADELDVIFTGDFPAILGKSAGFNVRLIGVSSSGYLSQAGVVSVDSPITSVSELKGKRIATFTGTTAHHLLVLALKEVGLELSDINLFNLTLPDMNNALLKGDIDAAFLWEPVLSKLEIDGTTRVIRNGEGLKNAIAVIEATDSFVTNHLEEAKAVLRAYERGAELIRRNPDEAAKLVAAELNQPEPIIRRSLEKFTYSLEFTDEVIDALIGTEAFLREQGMVRRSVDINNFVDRSVLIDLSKQ